MCEYILNRRHVDSSLIQSILVAINLISERLNTNATEIRSLCIRFLHCILIVNLRLY
jgi:hypothetical protein